MIDKNFKKILNLKNVTRFTFINFQSSFEICVKLLLLLLEFNTHTCIII